MSGMRRGWQERTAARFADAEPGSHDDDVEPTGSQRYSPGRLGGSPAADCMAALHPTGAAGSPRGDMVDALPLLGCAGPGIARFPRASATDDLLSWCIADAKRRLHRQ